MQGYADRNIPANGLHHIICYVQAPPAIANELRDKVNDEANHRGLLAEDAFAIFPPTRAYTDSEIRKELAARRVDGILIISAADSGISREYAGTIFNAQYTETFAGQGTAMRTGNITNASVAGSTSGSGFGMATPVYWPRRETAFEARLLDPTTARTLWVGNGQVSSSGRLFVLAGIGPSQSVSAVFNDLQSKGLIAPSN